MVAPLHPWWQCCHLSGDHCCGSARDSTTATCQTACRSKEGSFARSFVEPPRDIWHRYIDTTNGDLEEVTGTSFKIPGFCLCRGEILGVYGCFFCCGWRFLNLNLLSVVFVVFLRGLLNLGISFRGKVVYCSFVRDTWGLDEIAMKLVR